MDAIVGEDLPILKEIKKFVIKSGGKRIRPLLHYYFSQILGYGGKDWKDVGAIGELIHAASLLHDDVVDEGFVRRGTPTTNALHGNKTAVLSGDFLFSCALDHLATLKDAQALIPIFTRVIRLLSVGELIQMRYEKDLNVKREQYQRIIHGKTGSLFGAMVESAAVLVGLPMKERLRYRSLGEGLGSVFQIRDDYLDYFADEKAFGKKRYQDFFRGVVTPPILHLRDQMKSGDKKELQKLWKDESLRKSEHGVRKLEAMFAVYDTRQKMAQELTDRLNEMKRFLDTHGSSRYRNSILEQLDKLSEGLL